MDIVYKGEVHSVTGVGYMQSAYLQIQRDYVSLPDPRTLTLGEILFYYEGLQGELIKRTSS